MCKNFEVEFAAIAGDETFLVSSLLNEDNFAKDGGDSLDETLKNFPFLVKDILEIPEGIGMDRIEEVLGIDLARGIGNYVIMILNLIHKSNPKLREIFDKNEGNSTFRVTRVEPITIH